MAEAAATVGAAPSPAIEIPRAGTSEYAEWRLSGGEIPEKAATAVADSSSADTSGKTESDDAADSAARDEQEHRRKKRPDIEARFKQYTDRIDKLERELAEATKAPRTQADSSPAKPKAPQNYKEWREHFKPGDWTKKYAAENPKVNWEDVQLALSEHVADVRGQFAAHEARVAETRKAVGDKVAEAEKRYADFKKVAQPVSEALANPAGNAQENANTLLVTRTLNDSPVLADLLYAIGGSEETKADFLEACRTNPSKALRVALLMEQEIVAELGKARGDDREDAPAQRDGKGKFVAAEPDEGVKPPAKRGPESAPAPPLEVSNRGAGTMDESERALKDAAKGDARAFTRFREAENRKSLGRRRGT